MKSDLSSPNILSGLLTIVLVRYLNYADKWNTLQNTLVCYVEYASILLCDILRACTYIHFTCLYLDKMAFCPFEWPMRYELILR